MKSRFAFRPLLVGASLVDRLFAALGALVAIALMACASTIATGGVSLLVAPVAASAVLLFAIPASPLTQPWPVIGGSIVSTLVGIGVAWLVPVPWLATGVAVAGAIVAMSLLRCLHPPGGAHALLGLLAGGRGDWTYALFPVGLDAAILVALGWLFHRFSRHAYPHRTVVRPIETLEQEMHRDDIDAALVELGETFDIGREDLETLLLSAERHAATRRATSRLRS